jgi:tetratricopeptide (TPR) repeat protein
MKRKTRKHLKEDQFQKIVTQSVEFIKDHTKEISLAGAGLVIIILIVVVIQVINVQSLKKQNVVLDQIRKLSSEVADKPENLQELENLAGNGKFSRMAYLELAKYWFERDDYAKTQSCLENIKGKRDLFYYQAQDLLAQVFINRNDFDKAIEIYKTIENENPKSYVLDAVLFHRAEAHEKKGETEEALTLFKRVKEEFPQTYYGYDATAKVTELEQKK